jgi:hypothetical protein
LAIFPKRISRNDPTVHPLTSGTAQIALQVKQTKRWLDLKILPVGLNCDAKSHLRCYVRIEIGMLILIDLPHAQTRNAVQKPAANDIKRLTGQIQDALQDVIHSHETGEEVQLIAPAAGIWVQMAQSNRRIRPWTIQQPVGARSGQDIRGSEDITQRTDALRQNLRAYDVMLGAAGLRDAQVGAPPPALTLRFLAQSLFTLIVRLPHVALGSGHSRRDLHPCPADGYQRYELRRCSDPKATRNARLDRVSQRQSVDRPPDCQPQGTIGKVGRSGPDPGAD